jgi:hypothetical protein
MQMDEMQHHIDQYNYAPNPEFCGLSLVQMQSWLFSSLDTLEGVQVNTPDDLSSSPVMQYLGLMLELAMQNGGSIKLTPKGNLPTVLVKQSSELRTRFALVKYIDNISICEFAGHNEDSFNALHYARVLSDIAGIFYIKSGKLHLKKTAQKQYQTQGLHAFFQPMLQAALKGYNWAYMDGHSEDDQISKFWLFMLWRAQKHRSFLTLVKEMITAFPDLLFVLPTSSTSASENHLKNIVKLRFVKRFLVFWGFAIMNPRSFDGKETVDQEIEIQPLLTHTFVFDERIK